MHQPESMPPNREPYLPATYNLSNDAIMPHDFYSNAQQSNPVQPEVMHDYSLKASMPVLYPHLNYSSQFGIAEGDQPIKSQNFSVNPTEYLTLFPGPQTMPSSENDPSSTPNALCFLDSVKKAFKNQPRVYTSFLELMQNFRNGRIAPPLYNMNYPNYSNHLPIDSRMPQIVPSTQDIYHPPHPLPTQIYDQPPQHRMLPRSSAQQPSDYAINFVQKIRVSNFDKQQRFSKNIDVYSKFLAILQRCKVNHPNFVDGTPESKRLHTEVYNEVSKLLVNDQDLLEEFINFLPDFAGEHAVHQQNKQREEANNAEHNNNRRLKRKIIEETPAKISNSKPLEPAPENKPVQKEVVVPPPPPRPTPVEELKTYPEWFLKREENTKLISKPIFEEVRKKLARPIALHFLRSISLYNQHYVSNVEISVIIRECFTKDPDLCEKLLALVSVEKQPFKEGPPVVSQEALENGYFSNKNVDKRPEKTIGASYFPYSKEYVQPKCSGRTQLADSVLNNRFVSLYTFSENTTYPGSIKSQAFFKLHNVESERFAWDLLVSRLNRAISFIDLTVSKIEQHSHVPSFKLKTGSPISLYNFHRVLYFLYSDKTSHIFDGLESNALITLGILRKRIQAKLDETMDYLHTLRISWNLTSKRYAIKNLDHQSEKFKIQDQKKIKINSLLHEISCNSGPGPVITIEFDQPELCVTCIHLIYYSLKRVLNVNKSDKVKILNFLKSFHTFLSHVDFDEIFSDDSSLLNENMYSFPPAASCNVLYFPKHLYAYLRLFYNLYLRLKLAHELSQKPNTISEFVKSFHSPVGNKSNINFCRNNGRNTPAVSSESNSDSYEGFINIVYSLIDNDIDIEKFEDHCFSTLGLDSYKIFNIDKVLNIICKQLTLIATASSHQILLNNIKWMAKEYTFNMESRETNNFEDFSAYWNENVDPDFCCAARFERNSHSLRVSLVAVELLYDKSELPPTPEAAEVEENVISMDEETPNNDVMDWMGVLNSDPARLNELIDIFCSKLPKVNQKVALKTAKKRSTQNLITKTQQDDLLVLTPNPATVVCFNAPEDKHPFMSKEKHLTDVGLIELFYVPIHVKNVVDASSIAPFNVNHNDRFQKWWNSRLDAIRDIS